MQMPASDTDHVRACCRELVKTMDLRKPHKWYPMARALKRRIIYHAGPTNSGKTYQALQVPCHPPVCISGE